MELELLHSLGCTNIYIYTYTFLAGANQCTHVLGVDLELDLRVPFDIPINAILPVLNGCSSVACCTRSPILYFLLPQFSSKSNPHDQFPSHKTRMLKKLWQSASTSFFSRDVSMDLRSPPYRCILDLCIGKSLWPWSRCSAMPSKMANPFFIDELSDSNLHFFLGISQLRLKCLQFFFFGVGS